MNDVPKLRSAILALTARIESKGTDKRIRDIANRLGKQLEEDGDQLPLQKFGALFAPFLKEYCDNARKQGNDIHPVLQAIVDGLDYEIPPRWVSRNKTKLVALPHALELK